MRGLMGVLVGWAFFSLAWHPTAMANPIAEVGETVADTTVSGARWTGHTLGAGVTWVLVNTDNASHFLWNTVHNQFLHPLVGALTLGGVQL